MIKKTSKQTSKQSSKKTSKQKGSLDNIATLPPNIIEGYVVDDASYNHFKSLISGSTGLCSGKTLNGKTYKVHIPVHRDYDTLLKNKHHMIIYLHDNNRILAYISIQLYYRDGNFMFIHKMCSSMPGLGGYLMRKTIKYARANDSKLNITYLSLTTHNLDLIKYYSKFKPDIITEIDSPGSKRKIPRRVAYIVWKLNNKMPDLSFQ